MNFQALKSRTNQPGGTFYAAAQRYSGSVLQLWLPEGARITVISGGQDTWWTGDDGEIIEVRRIS